LTYTAVSDMVKEFFSIYNAISCLKAYIIYSNKLPRSHVKNYQKNVEKVMEQ